MTARPVEWILAIYYGPSAHRATYGRLDDTRYTKDYIQLSRKEEFIETVKKLFPVATSGEDSVPLTYMWPTGTAPGEFVFLSADRPHLKWETSLGAPKAWKMFPATSEATAETIPGDPTHLDAAAAEEELALLKARGAGQPYLMAIKLRDEPQTLHLRAYLANPSKKFGWADVGLIPGDVQALVAKTSQRSALAWKVIQSGGTAPTQKVKTALAQLAASKDPASLINTFDADTGVALTAYLEHPAYGLFFDPSRNHDAWSQPLPLPKKILLSVDDLLGELKAQFLTPLLQGDAAAESLEISPEQVEVFRQQIQNNNFEVDDSYSTSKTRGSAQRAFSDAVKKNYDYRCAITKINTNCFLVSSHIVPWSQDKTIRLDPSNGICLSLIMDRAFENGYIIIDDDLTIVVNWEKVGNDVALGKYVKAYDGKKLSAPLLGAPRPEYLQRRRDLVISMK
jgi:hypothetical protein